MKGGKYVGILLIIPMFTMLLSFGYSNHAFALNVSTDEGNGGHRFGATTKGIMPTAEIEAKSVEAKAIKPQLVVPFLIASKVTKPSADSENLYRAVYKVYPGGFGVSNLVLGVKSDRDQATATMGGIGIGSSGEITMYLKARDPSSIKAEILSWQPHDLASRANIGR